MPFGTKVGSRVLNMFLPRAGCEAFEGLMPALMGGGRAIVECYDW